MTEKLIVNLYIIKKYLKAEKSQRERRKNYYHKVLLEKYNSNDSYNVDSDEKYFDDSDDCYEKIPMKKIKCVDLFLEETRDLTSIHPKMHEIIVSQSFLEIFFRKNTRVFYSWA